MKTIKGTINYCFFCFAEIHSFNFNFTLTVLMYNFAAKNFIFPSGSLKLICLASSVKQQNCTNVFSGPYFLSRGLPRTIQS